MTTVVPVGFGVYNHISTTGTLTRTLDPLEKLGAFPHKLTLKTSLFRACSNEHL